MKVLIAGGGTAGHINPGLAIAKYIKSKSTDTKIIFVGTERGLETKLVPREGFELKLIKVRGFRRKLSKETFISVKEMFQGFHEARSIVKEFKPDIVIGTGGYVCGPVVFSAAMRKIPTLIHEQNAFPGVTNRILSRFSNITAISFKESEKFFKGAKKIVLTGNPIRKEMLEIDRAKARESLKVDSSNPLVVIFGGSLGAEKINQSVVDMLKTHYREGTFKLIYATGEKQYKNVMEKLEGLSYKSVQVLPYIFDMAGVMAAADLAVCRAGAITISELTALSVPSIMIPSPYVTANHQEHNAKALEKHGAALVILEKDLNGEVLHKKIIDTIKNKAKLKEMSKNASMIGVRDAADKIYSLAMGIKV
ncbi:undecaprenyldiphospho-muramoylpentapeptide beta-N-acetylglucosaminyltransferase [Pseudobacteroides cellulosolvens]|uniref:UDP-N-acetylglucosamine--N-acetylmuramyl-(pentapeptide) pyrophosphoryl-undecaprenol N-acetylglucosamine transferase n=1 Tax=Pseudobacteroides cellulosolvens ATCC 35603 = DSM 2933 TaxID=398512 RepID=A0A0L6JGV1_9FIRM|nr:undecaprenyldiphospho-muramoylpentapeptide beta-N-acetylglucosaminyltransferase [Pseudobacteroides cellulosolvens]KNY24944.1 UDP-N-acetylglucosamine--N-acetylmuramyl-(pentapeptide) pyrophosphoryl-undecaprenol N-acetylglucosamine transferase [Pseudobacteroides cellulosolvens ATCC 35603 = DSM 2933]